MAAKSTPVLKMSACKETLTIFFASNTALYVVAINRAGFEVKVYTEKMRMARHTAYEDISQSPAKISVAVGRRVVLYIIFDKIRLYSTEIVTYTAENISDAIAIFLISSFFNDFIKAPKTLISCNKNKELFLLYLVRFRISFFYFLVNIFLLILDIDIQRCRDL